MPIFEYRCSECGHHFEQIIAHDKTGTCPKCKSKKLQKELDTLHERLQQLMESFDDGQWQTTL